MAALGRYKALSFDVCGMPVWHRGMMTALTYTAESMFHDHAQARVNNITTDWICRRHQNTAFGVTMDPGKLARTIFRFNALSEMTGAHKRGTI